MSSSNPFLKQLAGRYKSIFKSKIGLIVVGLAVLMSLYGIYWQPPLYIVSANIPVSTILSSIDKLRDSTTVNKISGATSKQQSLSLLKSKILISHLASDDRFQVNFYKQNRLHKSQELYEDQVPIEIKILRNDLNTNRTYQFKPINHSNFVLVDDDGNSKIYSYGQLVESSDLAFAVSNKPKKVGGSQNLFLQVDSRNKFTDDVVKKMEVQPASADTSVANLSIKDVNPLKASHILQAIYHQFLLANVNYAEDRKALLDIDKQIKALKEELAQNSKLKDTYTAKPVAAKNNSKKLNYKEAKKQLSVLQILKPYLNNSPKQFSLLPSAYKLLDDSLNNLIIRYNTNQFEKQQALKTEPATSAKVKSTENTIIALTQLILRKINADQRFYNKFINHGNLQKSIPIKTKLDANKYAQDYQAKVRLYLYLVAQRENVLANKKLIDQLNKQSANLIVTVSKSYYYRFLYGGLGLALLIILPLIIALLTAKKHTKLDIATIQRFTSIPVLGMVHDLPRWGDISAGKNPQNGYQMSAIARKVLSILDKNDKEGKVVIISSDAKSSGKALISANLAHCVAQTGKKVLLVNAQVGQINTIDITAQSITWGLADYIEDIGISVSESIQKTDVATNLFVIGAGKTAADEDDLFANERFQVLLQQVKQQFDYIIIEVLTFTQINNNKTLIECDSCINIVDTKLAKWSLIQTFETFSKNNQIKNPLLLFNESKV